MILLAAKIQRTYSKNKATSSMLQARKNLTCTHVCGSWAASSADSRSPAVEPAGADDVAADRFLFPRRKLKASKWIDIEEYMHKHTKKQRPFLLALLHKHSARSLLGMRMMGAVMGEGEEKKVYPSPFAAAACTHMRASIYLKLSISRRDERPSRRP